MNVASTYNNPTFAEFHGAGFCCDDTSPQLKSIPTIRDAYEKCSITTPTTLEVPHIQLI
ncbi:MAG: hypothetical protein ACK5L5_02685 [Bacteroidales bacterium]